MSAPCKDCEKRHLNCHAHCEAYQAFAQENAKRLEARHKDSDIFAYQYDTKQRIMRYKHRRRRK